MKEEFFSKFIDYNQRLEKILETKDFSEDVKNLLLSMLYKIDVSYPDYQTVKRKAKSKKDFLEDILRIVENCESIELVKPNSEEGKKFEEEHIKYQVDSFIYAIKAFANEKVILEALFELDNTRFYLPEKYNLIRIAFPDLLNEGKAINRVEIIRDFNAWSWNILSDEISNFYANLIYQNLELLIEEEELEDWLITDENENKIEWLTQKLKKEHQAEEVDRFLSLLYQIAIDSCVNQNTAERRRLLDEKVSLQEEYEKLSHKEIYLEQLTQIKKDKNKEIEKIDRILNDKKKLQEEYKKRNRALKEYNKILNIEHLVEIMHKQRRRFIREIERVNEQIQPNQYLQTIEKIQKELKLLEDVSTKKISKQKIETKMIELEVIFLQFFKEKAKQTSKKDRIDFVHKIRYYKNIPFNEKECLGEIKELSSLFQEMEEWILNQLYEEKQINKIAEDKSFTIKVLRNIFDTKIIDLGNIYIQLKQIGDQYQVQLYDKEILEKEIPLENTDKEMKEFKIKRNKLIKVFI